MVRKHQAANGGTSSLEALSCIVGTSAAVSYFSFAQQEQQMLDAIKGVELFPLEKAQDLLEYLAANVTELDKHIHRFPGEWNTIAKVRSESIKNGTTI